MAIVWAHSVCTATVGNQVPMYEIYVGSASLFFMASGALIFPVRPTAGAFLRRRLSSYLPQWLLFTVAYVVLAYVTATPDLDSYRFANLLRYMPLLSPWEGGWFLYALTGLYLFAPVLSPWLTTASRRGLQCFVALWLVAGLVPVIDAVADVEPRESLVAPFAGFVGYMVAGYYLSRYPLRARTASQRLLFFAIWGVVALGLGTAVYASAAKWGYASVLRHDLGFTMMAANMLIFGLFTMCPAHTATVSQWLPATATWISRHSLTIYLWHLLIIRYVLVPAGVETALIFPLTLLTALPLSALTDRAFAPLLRLLRHI